LRKNFIIFLLLNSILTFGQASKIDSLKVEYTKSNVDSIRAQLLYNISYNYLFHDYDSTISFAKKLIKFSEDKPKLKKFIAMSYMNIGNGFSFKNEFDSASVYIDLSLKESDKFLKTKSSAYVAQGIMYRRQGKYKEAIEAYLEGIKIDEKLEFQYGLFGKYANIANVYYDMLEYDKSIEYNNKAIEVSEYSEDERIDLVIGVALGNIAQSYQRKGNLEGSLKYLKKALNENLKNQNKTGAAKVYLNIANVYSQIGNIKLGIENGLKALKMIQGSGDNYDLIDVNKSLGVLYGKGSEEKKSKYHFNAALEIALRSENLTYLSETYLDISNHYSGLLNDKIAFEFFKKHIEIKDSIFKIEKIENLNNLEIKYQTEKKDKEIAQQNLQLVEKDKEIQKKNAQYGYMLGIVLLLLVGLTSLWFIYQQRQKRKNQEILTLKREQQVKTLESLMEGEEKERLRISKELHDGVNVDLSAIKYKLTSMLEKNHAVINEVVTMIDKSCEQVRAISHNLVPPSLKDFSLVETIEDFCATTNNIHNPEITFTHIGEAISISKKAEVNIFRIIQELVNNSVKHAEASEINVQLSNHHNNIQLTVEDNGKGFNKEETESNGIGLQNIQSRVDYLAANLDFSSNQKGTSYIIEINTQTLS